MRAFFIGVAAALAVVSGSATAAGFICSPGSYLSARFAADQFDFEKAATLYRDCLNGDKNDIGLLQMAFYYSTAAGQIDQSAALAKRIVAISSDVKAAHLTLAVEAMKRRDYREARAEIAKAVAGKGAPYTFTIIGAWIAAGQGEESAAAADLKAVKARDGAARFADFNAALIADSLGHAAEAEAGYGRLWANAADRTPRLIEAYGRFLEQAGRRDEAKALYETAIRSGNNEMMAASNLRRMARGEKPAPFVASLQDGVAEVLFTVAASMDDAEPDNNAVLFLRLALYLRPDLDIAKVMLAERLANNGKHEAAIALYDEIPPASTYYMHARMMRAGSESESGNDQAALKDLLRLADENPDNVDVWMALGDCRRRLGNSGEAIAAFSKAIALTVPKDKKAWRLYFARAVSEQEAGNWPGAEADLKAALSFAPDEPQVLNYLGYSWVDQGNHLDEALNMLKKARDIDPSNGLIADSVGWAYYRLGRYAEAVMQLEQAVVLAPGNAIIDDHLGDAYWKIGRKLEAQFQWNHALTFGPDDKEKAEIGKKLEVGLADEK
jgi:tetratricopeptide (TPR) repeat protein